MPPDDRTLNVTRICLAYTVLITAERRKSTMPHPIDSHVGKRLRTLRQLRGISQEELGRHLGVSFQQVQKYEKGVNRIGSSRLYQIAQLFGISVQYFFEDASRGKGVASTSVASHEHGKVLESLMNSQGMRLALAYASIPDPLIRRCILRLVEALGAEKG